MSSDSSEVTVSTLGEAPASISKLSASPDPSEAPSTTVLVAGGGICGLLCGLALSALGVDCHIYEQRGTPGPSQSGEIAYLITEELDKFLAAHKVAVDRTRVRTAGRQVLADDGDVQLQDSRSQDYISYEALHSALLECFPQDNYHAASKVTLVDASHPDVVVLQLDSGERIAGHLLVAADGVTSSVRQQLLPNCQPAYAGYLAWRGVAALDSLSAEVQHHLADKGTLYKGANLHMLVHPLPCSSSSSAAAGEGQPLAWTWFNNQAAEELPGLLLDAGLRVYPHAVPVGRLSPAVADAVAAAAAEALPQPLAELVASSTRCMGVAAVSDMALPCHALGRVAFAGEAGCVARPHGSSSVDKALQDAVSLADTLKAAKFSVDRALHAWSLQRVPQSVALCRAAAAAGNRLQGTEEC